MRNRPYIWLALSGLLASVFTLAPSSPASAAGPTTVVDGVAGAVYSVINANGTTYLGGNFSAAGAAAGGWASTAASDGAINRNWPVANGAVYASVSDGSGGFYIAGDFTLVGTQARSRVAHVLSDGSINRSWAPPVNDGIVYAMARSGSVLYFGGDFTQVDSTARGRIAAVDTSTGALLGWNPNVTNNSVRAITVLGSTVYFGGNFTGVGGSSRNRIAAASAYTDGSNPGGTVLAWNPNASTNNAYVYALAASGSTVYAGGTFTTIGGLTRNRIAALNAATGAVNESWNTSGAQNGVRALALSGSTLYAAGNFTTFAGSSRSRVAAIGTDGTLLSWAPAVSVGTVLSLTVDSGTVYIGGTFSQVGSTSRERAAAVTAYTSGESPGGTLTNWNPMVTTDVNTIGVSGSQVLTGGVQGSLYNFVTRNNLAAVGSDGRLTSWNPDSNGQIRTMVLDGSTLYVAGSMTSVGGTSRTRAAAVTTYSSEAAPGGTLLGWAPSFSDLVFAMAKSGSTMYVGGQFTTAGGQTRTRLAAVRTYTDEASPGGTLLGWNPSASGNGNQVRGLAVAGNSVYVGGDFATVNSTSRRAAAAISTYTDESSPGGALQGWNVQLSNGSVFAVMVSGSTVYLGGDFSGTNSVNGSVTRNRAVAVSAYTSEAAPGGVATSWDPNLSGTVWSIAQVGSTIYMGGDFSQVGTTTRNGAAAVDVNTAALAAWNPSVGNGVYSISADSSVVYLAGAQQIFKPDGSGMGGPSLWPSAVRIAKLQAATANPPQAGSATVSGDTLSWVPGVNGGISTYFVMYRPVGSGKAWGQYATGTAAVANTYVRLSNPGTRSTCSAANTALGYSSCAMPYGWQRGVTYEFAVYARSQNGKTSLLPLQALTTYQPS